MNFQPKNKYLLVEREEKKPEDNSGFLFPKDYSEAAERHVAVRLVRASDGSDYKPLEGSLVIVSTNMIDEVRINKTKFLVTPENAVIAVLVEE